MERIVITYRGSFLEGFSCDSAPFEEWILVRREQTNRQIVSLSVKDDSGLSRLEANKMESKDALPRARQG